MALTAFVQDIEVWNHKAPCINGLFIPSDGAFMKARIWYKQFYNPRAKKQEFLDQAEASTCRAASRPTPTPSSRPERAPQAGLAGRPPRRV
jgi:3-ketosteroid 9alpha-monooxygenase subunit A